MQRPVAWIMGRLASLITFFLTVFAGCHPVSRRDPLVPVDRADLPLRIRHVTGGIYSVEDGNFWKTNSVFWIGENGVYFFDATYQPRTAEALLWKAMTLTHAEFRGLILTSRHQHHAGGAQAFVDEGIPVLIQRTGAARFEEDWIQANQWLSQSFLHWDRTPLPKLRGVIDKEFELEKGNIRVIFPGEGWSDDNLVVLFKEERMLYGGSLVAYPPLFTAKVDAIKALRALNAVEKLPFDKVISGHGTVVQGRDIFRKLHEYYRNH